MKKSLHTQEHKKLIHWLKETRLNQNLTMRDLAARMKVPHSFVGKVEQGERRLDVVEFKTYCEALEVSPHTGLDVIEG